MSTIRVCSSRSLGSFFVLVFLVGARGFEADGQRTCDLDLVFQDRGLSLPLLRGTIFVVNGTIWLAIIH